jgi:hypothetical protein
MPDAFLRVRFSDDGDGTGELNAYASSGCFSGTGRAYFHTGEVEEFASALAAFPITNDARPRIAGGYLRKTGGPGELSQEHLGITVYPINSRGYIGIQVRMATTFCEGDRPESRESATVELVTTHIPLARFSRELIEVLRGSAEEAVLIGGDR